MLTFSKLCFTLLRGLRTLSNDIILPNGEHDKLDNLLKSMKNVSGEYSTFSSIKKRHKSSNKKFNLKVLKNINDHIYYHVTLYKNLDSILNIGLLKSKSKNIEFGWTDEFNFDLQNAVYLYSSLDEAYKTAQYLANDYNEATMILQVDGNALSEYSKIVADEDSYRNTVTGSVDYNYTTLSKKYNLPHYYNSLLNMDTIAYKDNIPSKYIKLYKIIEPITD